MGCRIAGGRIVHRDLIADSRPIGTRQFVGDDHDVADRGVVDHPWL